MVTRHLSPSHLAKRQTNETNETPSSQAALPAEDAPQRAPELPAAECASGVPRSGVPLRSDTTMTSLSLDFETALRKLKTLIPSPARRLAHRMRVSVTVRRFNAYQITHQYGQTQLTVEIPDPMAADWYGQDWPSLPELELLQTRGALSEGALVFDLGAHHAVVALMAASYVGISGTVVAVEAEAHNVRAAKRNVALNNANNVIVIHAAATARSGTVSFTESLNGSVAPDGGAGSVNVDGVTLDDLTKQFGIPSAVLIDVEGHEAAVLAGGANLIQRLRTSFFVEVHSSTLRSELLATIVDAFSGYELLAAEEAGWPDQTIFREFHESEPSERFFMLAIPPSQRFES